MKGKGVDRQAMLGLKRCLPEEIQGGKHTFKTTMSKPNISCPMLCPKPQRAPNNVALMLLRPMVSGVKACKESIPCQSHPTSYCTACRKANRSSRSISPRTAGEVSISM